MVQFSSVRSFEQQLEGEKGRHDFDFDAAMSSVNLGPIHTNALEDRHLKG